MSKNLVTVWNASASIVKIGKDKTLLKPAESVEVERTPEINALIDAKKLVVLLNIKNETAVVEVEPESTTRKKTKKDVVQEDLKEETETEVLEENQQQMPTEDTESPEDSILPEESV
jgi:hypothetical protein